MNLKNIWTYTEGFLKKKSYLCGCAAYRKLGEAGVLAGFQQYVRCCRWNAGGRCYVCAPVTVLIILLPDPWRCGHLWVILRVGRLRKSLLMRWPWVVVARVVPMVGHRWGQWGFGGRRWQATGIVNRGDLSRRAHHGEEYWQENQAIQHPQNSQDGQHSEEIPEEHRDDEC